MIHDSLLRWRSVPGLAQHPIWSIAFAWLETSAASAVEGIHPLGEEGFYARVMSYATKSRDTARYEMHRVTIDIQFTLKGGEGIEVTPVEELTPLNDYNPTKEVEHLQTPSRFVGLVENREGRFTILFPGEPHMPQLRLPESAFVAKVVIKIPHLLVDPMAMRST